MKTSPECIPCFFKQAHYAAGLATVSESLQQTIIDRSADLINSINFNISPPENAIGLYRLIADLSGNPDIFSELKKTSNRTAINMASCLTSIVNKSIAPYKTAAKLAIAGNIIDYGAQQDFDIEKSIGNALSDNLAIDDLDLLSYDINKASNILYLGDNCGELVFDRLFIETMDKPLTFSVKKHAIINDALIEDALECGLDKLCHIISNGTDCPGTPLNYCSEEFINIWNKADLIISKGQGNFETLSETPGPIYFLLMVKCPVVAGHINTVASSVSNGNIKTGDMIIMQHRLFS